MSISAMTNVAMARRTDIPTTEPVPSTTAAIVEATAGTPESRQGVGGALQAIMTYIPTEILALYTSIATAIQSTNTSELTGNAGWIAFVVCLCITPASVWLMYAGKVKLAGKELPISFSKWPVWEMFAATVAFAAWPYSMPNSPFRFIEGYYSPGIAAIVLPGSATVLGLLAPIVQRPLNP
ncbi:MAG TPA: hypothetical protein PLY87_19225 [Planctomycetaceae bacterium]|nr:hypothetical protein [Planctomycetaceae bacterium]HQZ67235.1 hypothetical protein [Planctomycetaceae bacterium]